MFWLQNARLTEAACVHLPATWQSRLIFSYPTHHHTPDPRVLDVLLRHWGHASLRYPSPHHHREQHQQLQDLNIDCVSEISLRQRSLGVALAFLDAARFNTLRCLRTLRLATLCTGQISDARSSYTFLSKQKYGRGHRLKLRFHSPLLRFAVH